MSDYNPSPEVLQTMLRKASEKLAIAKKILESEFYDDAASRAYYAAFHAISAVLAERGLTFSSHAQVHGAFNREFVKTGLFPANTFNKIRRLFKDRQVGDYEWSSIIDKEGAERDIADAEWLVNECREYIEKRTGRSYNDK